ncbi:MAG: ABC transporter permease subunit [Phycisphaeraceae bacterium]|nr:ABC transporter permease subunit [Phycisphaeraceae bacterium]
MITQTLALFIDAYRELNARRLFWITMALNVLAVAAVAIMGINERGITLLHWEFPLPMINSTNIAPSLFYKFIFVQIGIPVWLTWVATVLALVSTASMIPDFIAGGAIELTLSKPVSRVRLLLTKFATGLLFVALQVTVFTLGVFLVIGLRGNEWEPRLWLAVPIVLLFFSYLYSVMMLLGLLTRSTIASLLLTLLVWFVCFGVNVTDGIFLNSRENAAVSVERRAAEVNKLQAAAAKMLEKARADGVDVPTPQEGQDELDAISPMLVMERARLKEAQQSHEKWIDWTRKLMIAKTCLPKTSETIGLLNRNLVSLGELEQFMNSAEGRQRQGNDRRVELRVEEALRERTTAWVIGTSLIFEALVLGLACLIFARRDF